MQHCQDYIAVSGPSARLKSILCLFSLWAFPLRNQYSEERTDAFLLWFLRNWDTAHCSGITPSLPAVSSSAIWSLRPSSTKFDRRRHCFPPNFMKLHVWVEKRDVECPPSWGFFHVDWVHTHCWEGLALRDSAHMQPTLLAQTALAKWITGFTLPNTRNTSEI